MIPLRATNYKLAESWPPAIIIHHTYCRIKKSPLEFDKQAFQADKVQILNYKIRGEYETGFNFIVDRVKTDFQVIVSQPLTTLCEYEDLDERYWKAIHVGLVGNYNKDIPMNRLYRVLAYRVLSPLMRLFALKEADIIFHSTISNNSDETCPGEFVDMERILMNLRSIIRKRPLARRK